MRHSLVLALLVAPLQATSLGAQAAEPVPVSPSTFHSLRWLEGVWRGSGGGFEAFYEDFRWADDSTVLRHSYSDSTLATVTETSEIRLRDGHAFQWRNGERRAAVVLARNDSLRFSSGVLWIRRSDDHWTAILANGRTTYELRRFKP